MISNENFVKRQTAWVAVNESSLLIKQFSVLAQGFKTITIHNLQKTFSHVSPDQIQFLSYLIVNKIHFQSDPPRNRS